MLKAVYLIFGLTLIGGYAFSEIKGIEFESAEVERVPPDVRQSPGGYRSFHFWHSGYKGGK